MHYFKELGKKEKAKCMASIALYPLMLLFSQLGKVCRLFSTSGRRPTASILCAAVFFTMLTAMPLTAFAAEPIPLTFTAQAAGSSVTLNYKSGDNVQYKLGSGVWTDYTNNTPITLTNKNDTVSFMGTNVTTDQTHHFSMTGAIAASGDVTSLTNEVGGDAPLSNSCYLYMFSGCTSLTAAPALNATTLAEGCYAAMFNGCTGLTAAPALPATTLANSCYSVMFQGCTGFTAAPALPATTLADSCYSYMFQGCTGLTAAPTLPATTLADYCYSYMFYGCTKLSAAPALNATTLVEGCYRYMFDGCTDLTSAPALNATTLADYCYSYMFQGCTDLTAAPELPATALADYCYSYMFRGCTDLTAAPALNATTLAEGCYRYMFDGCTDLTAAPALNATTLAEKCYSYMFQGCTDLTAAPELPATALAKDCYFNMFQGCTGLTAAPALPATKLANYCYCGMFQGCTDLTAAPALNATTLAYNCYGGMFYGCTGITAAPALPATTLDVACYSGMFYGCTGITAAPELPATTLASECYLNMFYGCTDLTSAPALNATTLKEYCYAGMFYGCTGLTAAPALPATTLAESCYYYMFEGCTGLKISATKTGAYIKEWRIPSTGSISTPTTANNWNLDMLKDTGGTFTGDPEVNTTYYNMQHNWKTEWSSDGTNHWHECSDCGEKKDNAAHIWNGGVVTQNPTVTEKGVKTYTCTICGATKTEEIDKLASSSDGSSSNGSYISGPSIIEGNNAIYQQGSKGGLTFKSNASFADFVSVSVDGMVINQANYTLKEDNTIVTLTADYLATLSVGKHTLSINSSSGTASTEFTIAAKAIYLDPPATGDASNVVKWIALLFVSGGALTTLGISMKCKKASSK